MAPIESSWIREENKLINPERNEKSEIIDQIKGDFCQVLLCNSKTNIKYSFWDLTIPKNTYYIHNRLQIVGTNFFKWTGEFIQEFSSASVLHPVTESRPSTIECMLCNEVCDEQYRALKNNRTTGKYVYIMHQECFNSLMDNSIDLVHMYPEYFVQTSI